jgi:predicted nucleic acid-binding protein
MLCMSVSGRITLDTNLLVYSVDVAAGLRYRLAIDIVRAAARADCVLTLQAISEFFSAVTRKRLMVRNQAAALAAHWLDVFPHTSGSADSVRAALADADAGRAAFWDAMLVATAAEAGCSVALTEDLQHGSTLRGVEIHNPFDPAGGLTDRARVLLGL